MAIELYCDGAVVDHTEATQGACSHCGAVTDRKVKGWQDTTFRWECDDCAPESDFTAYDTRSF